MRWWLTDAEAIGQVSENRGLRLVQQIGQPMTHKGRQMFASEIALQPSAKAFVVGVNVFGFRGEGIRQRFGIRNLFPVMSLEIDGELVNHQIGDDVGEQRRVSFDGAGHDAVRKQGQGNGLNLHDQLESYVQG